MSYSLKDECVGCDKQQSCTDRHVIAGAISGIHMMPSGDTGHLGAGTIVIDCCNRSETAAESNTESEEESEDPG